MHADVRGRLEQLVRNYFGSNPIGGALSEVDCRLGERTVRRLDISIFLGDQWRQLDMKKVPVPFAPDIAIEVLSTSKKPLSVNRRVRDYLAAGSQEVWVLDSENCELHVRTKTGIRLLEGNAALETPLLPGFSVEVGKLVAGR